MNLHSMYFAALLTLGPPVYSGKYRSSGTYEMLSTWACRGDKARRTLGIFSRNTSILFIKKIIEVREKNGELMIEENSSIDSSKRFYGRCDENRDARNRENTTNMSACHLVIFTQCHAEHDTCDIVKMVHPLPLRKVLTPEIDYTDSMWCQSALVGKLTEATRTIGAVYRTLFQQPLYSSPSISGCPSHWGCNLHFRFAQPQRRSCVTTSQS